MPSTASFRLGGISSCWMISCVCARQSNIKLLRKTRGSAPEQIEQSLAFQAQAARQYAADILNGDFSAFAEVEAFLTGR